MKAKGERKGSLANIGIEGKLGFSNTKSYPAFALIKVPILCLTGCHQHCHSDTDLKILEPKHTSKARTLRAWSKWQL